MAKTAAEVVGEWEARGYRLAVEGGSVWAIDLPATDPAAGDPIFVLHGFPSCSFDWRDVIEPMRGGRRVVLFDFLGFGLSDKPDYRYSINKYADTAESVAAACGLEHVVLVTHDMGDSVGGELLARDLDGKLGFDVTARVITNGSIYLEMAHLTNGQQALLGADDERLDLAALGLDPEPGFKAGLAETFAVAPDPVELDAQWLLLSRERGHTVLTRTIRYIEDRRAEEARYTGAIEKHSSPVDIVWGELYPVAVHDMALRLKAARPDATLTTLDGVGHYPMIEDPTRFAAAVGASIAER